LWVLGFELHVIQTQNSNRRRKINVFVGIKFDKFKSTLAQNTEGALVATDSDRATSFESRNVADISKPCRFFRQVVNRAKRFCLFTRNRAALNSANEALKKYLIYFFH
jgi:hypothetical protein